MYRLAREREQPPNERLERRGARRAGGGGAGDCELEEDEIDGAGGGRAARGEVGKVRGEAIGEAVGGAASTSEGEERMMPIGGDRGEGGGGRG